ncbi:hypothetical protein BVRB_2g037130 [Beta vulgaris subsp. vulgaris]|nr:hypothetical protein BVRB_2g037130 [Beta vulgaris subsp. vulgaris]
MVFNYWPEEEDKYPFPFLPYEITDNISILRTEKIFII